MKLIKNFILLFAAILVFEFTFTKDANANDQCTKTGDVLDVMSDWCETEPDEYEVVIYNLYLCTSSPAIPTTTSTVNLDSGGCVEIFNNSSGATASVTQGSELNLSGTYTRPPNDIYTHGYAIMDNTFGITASLEFAGNMTGETGGTGIYCGTVAGSGTSGTSSETTNTSVCSSSPVTAGKFVETLADFGGERRFAATGSVSNINGTTASIKGILVDTNGHLAANEGEVDKLEGLVSFANAINVTSDTTSLTMSFNLGEGMSLNRAGADVIYIGSGPFQAIMTAN